ncbi:hypothetical protein FRX31_026435 [Thalictrum thalictroides]|uniref:Uncharacterized protein n=1 Tax=Thalictrum thalictroides TaxID=46969 RepID=A0A7J6VFT0_THATH|nr:hypothetical protein FRX31_026435 [Thalictrum thalictroides]
MRDDPRDDRANGFPNPGTRRRGVVMREDVFILKVLLLNDLRAQVLRIFMDSPCNPGEESIIVKIEIF